MLNAFTITNYVARHGRLRRLKMRRAEALLHVQATKIADKYDCASLHKLARTSFANTINAFESEDWVTIAALIYDRPHDN